MTTFKHGGLSLLKATALAATVMLWGSVGHADNAGSPATGAVHHTRLNCPPQNQMFMFDPASVNRYALLLFFDKSVNLDDVFSLTKPGGYGCIHDPDTDTAAGIHGNGIIIVQGSCPTDCTSKSKVADTTIKLGDPLTQLTPKFGTYKEHDPGTTARWGIFFADPKGGAEAANSDSDTTFTVWQILAKDSCHAGNILNWLKTNNSDVFSKPGYLGQIMIGYMPSVATSGPPHNKHCDPVILNPPSRHGTRPENGAAPSKATDKTP
jgi:hypothetical protein